MKIVLLIFKFNVSHLYRSNSCRKIHLFYFREFYVHIYLATKKSEVCVSFSNGFVKQHKACEITKYVKQHKVCEIT